MFNNTRIDKLYELMTRLNCVRQTGSTELLVNAKKYLATNATLIVRDSDECKRLKMKYGIDSINMHNTESLYGINTPIAIDKDVVVIIMIDLFNEIMNLQDKIKSLDLKCEMYTDGLDYLGRASTDLVDKNNKLEEENDKLKEELETIKKYLNINVNININKE